MARRAGLSVATVYRVFNTPAIVQAHTQEKVLRIATDIGHVANASVAATTCGQGREPLAADGAYRPPVTSKERADHI